MYTTQIDTSSRVKRPDQSAGPKEDQIEAGKQPADNKRATKKPIIASAQLWYTGEMDEVPVSYRENRKTWRKKKNRQPDLMSNPYFRKETKKVRDELEDSEEDVYDENDMDIRQA